MSIESAHYEPNRVGFAELALAPGSDVSRHLLKIGRNIERGAKRMVGVDTGALRESIHVRLGVDSRGQYVEVGSDLRYALIHHDGHRPHVIEPKRARFLRFTQGGRVRYAARVYHPGARANRYLTVPMTNAVLRS